MQCNANCRHAMHLMDDKDDGQKNGTNECTLLPTCRSCSAEESPISIQINLRKISPANCEAASQEKCEEKSVAVNVRTAGCFFLHFAAFRRFSVLVRGLKRIVLRYSSKRRHIDIILDGKFSHSL